MAYHLKPSQTFTDAQLRASCQVVSPLGTATAPFRNRMALQRVVQSAQRIFGGKLPAHQDTYSTRYHRKAKKIMDTKKRRWTLDWWQSVLWSDESKFEIFGSNRRVFVRRRVDEKMISACVVPTVKHGGGVVMVWGCFAGDAVTDLFKIQGTLNQHDSHSILQRYAFPSGLHIGL